MRECPFNGRECGTKCKLFRRDERCFFETVIDMLDANLQSSRDDSSLTADLMRYVIGQNNQMLEKMNETLGIQTLRHEEIADNISSLNDIQQQGWNENCDNGKAIADAVNTVGDNLFDQTSELKNIDSALEEFKDAFSTYSADVFEELGNHPEKIEQMIHFAFDDLQMLLDQFREDLKEKRAEEAETNGDT